MSLERIGVISDLLKRYSPIINIIIASATIVTAFCIKQFNYNVESICKHIVVTEIDKIQGNLQCKLIRTSDLLIANQNQGIWQVYSVLINQANTIAEQNKINHSKESVSRTSLDIKTTIDLYLSNLQDECRI